MEDEKLRELAQKHYEFLERWLHKIYIEAFIHGYKHGQVKKHDTET